MTNLKLINIISVLVTAVYVESMQKAKGSIRTQVSFFFQPQHSIYK